MALLSSFGKQGTHLGLLKRRVDIEDTDPSSKYFDITEFNPVFAAGKNSISFNGTAFLQDKSEIQVECLDSQGNSLYIEHAKPKVGEYQDSAKFVIAVHIYDETYNGQGKLIFVGTTKKGEIVRWVGNITIDKTMDNTARVRFYYKPTLEVRPLLYPVLDATLASTLYPPAPATVVAKGKATIHSYVDTVTITGTGTGYTHATVSTSGGGSSRTAKLTAVIVGGSITAITIDDGGEGYDRAPTITITGDGHGATATATIKSIVQSVVLTSSGSGYTFTPDVTFGGPGAGAQAVATVVNGSVTRVDMVDGGDGYTTVPLVSFTVPPPPTPADLNVPISFTGTFYTYAANPIKDTVRDSVNKKQIDTDYRLILTSAQSADLDPQTFPSSSFNSQMENQDITLYITQIQQPHSYSTAPTSITASFKIKKVLDSKTIVLDAPFYYQDGTNQYVTQITQGTFSVNYRFVIYNTNPDATLKFQVNDTTTVDVKESHAEITYRNLKTFSGFVARHKLYRKSSFYPGDFQLISDEPIGAPELLSDPVTFNKFYDRMGVFYHLPHINKYWFTSSNALNLEAVTTPINAMRIVADSFAAADGTEYVICKNDSIGITNDSTYYWYDETEFNNLSGIHYNSNFINLKQDVLYGLSTNLRVEKDPTDATAKVSFYFTSSTATVSTEPSFNSNFGIKLGEVAVPDNTSLRVFPTPQQFFFTPQNDYYGTLVIVPYHCNVTVSDVSLKVYGDHGFSPEIQSIRIPFKINVANEAFELKAELLDINSTVVYSDLRLVQTFDPDGASLIGSSTASGSSSGGGGGGGGGTGGSTTGSAYFPNLTLCDTGSIRLVGWHLPTGATTSQDGKICYTNIESLHVDSDDYIVLTSYESGIRHVAKSIAVVYDFSSNQGRKIVIDGDGNREEFP